MAQMPEVTMDVKLDVEPDVLGFEFRRVALDFAIQRSHGSITAESVVKDAAAFEEYLRNGASKAPEAAKRGQPTTLESIYCSDFTISVKPAGDAVELRAKGPKDEVGISVNRAELLAALA